MIVWKKCNIKKSRTWNIEHRDRYLEILKKDRQKPIRKLQFKENARRLRALGYQVEWQNNNRDKIKNYTIKRKDKNHNITTAQWKECLDFFDYKCAYCNLSLEEHKIRFGTQLHREHIGPNGSNEIDNCIPACKECNSSKHLNIMEEWYRQQPFFNEENLLKIYEWKAKFQ